MSGDLKTGRELLNEDFMVNPWLRLELMVKSKVKAEIQALSSFGFQYLSQVYLPEAQGGRLDLSSDTVSAQAAPRTVC